MNNTPEREDYKAQEDVWVRGRSPGGCGYRDTYSPYTPDNLFDPAEENIDDSEE